MLEAKKDQYLSATGLLGGATNVAPSELQAGATGETSLTELFAYANGVARRQKFVIILFALLGIGSSFVYIQKAVPTYKATATLLVDTRKLDVLRQLQSPARCLYRRLVRWRASWRC